MSNYDTTAGIENRIRTAINTSISNNDKATVRELISFVRKVTSKAVTHDSLAVFNQYIFFFSHFYSISFSKYKDNPSYQSMYIECAEMAALHLKEIILYEIKIFYKNKSVGTRESEFYYWGFFGFNQLLFNIVNNRDIVQFEDAFGEFSQINLRGSDFELENKIQSLKLEEQTIVNQEELKSLEKQRDLNNQFNRYGRHVFSGIKAWVYLIFKEDKISHEELKSYINQLNNPLSFKELLDDILYMRNTRISQYLGWDNWDYEHRPNNKFYYPPDPHNWLTLGFTIELIKAGSFYVDIENMSSDQLSNINYLYDSVKEHVASLRINFEKWRLPLNLQSLEDFDLRSKTILDGMAVIKRKNYSLQERTVAESNLDTDHVATFKLSTWKAWERKANMRRLFNSFANKEEIISDEIKLMQTGNVIFLRKAKVMFISGDYQLQIGGTEPWGGDLGIAEDNLFFHNILKGRNMDFKENSLEKLIDFSLLKLKNKGKNATVILLESYLVYRDATFLKNENYIPKSDLGDSKFTNERSFLGEYKGIPIFGLNNNYIKNKIVVAEFNEAFNMLYKTKDAWYNNLVQLDLKEIDDETAAQRLIKEPEYWKTTDEGIELTDEEAITMIKTSIILETGTVLNFVIKDADAYVIGQFQVDEVTQ